MKYWSHRNEKIQTLVNKDNKLLYSPAYQHECNSIEHYFSVLKSKLKKLDNLSYKQIDENIKKAIDEIPVKHYENIMKGTYNIDYGSKEMKKKTPKKTPKKNYKK